MPRHRSLRPARACVLSLLVACASAFVPVACAPSPAAATPPAAPAPAASAPAAPLPRVLVFSKTAGFRHQSIPDGIAAVRELGAGRWETDATEDAKAFAPDNLRRYRAVVFLSTTGNVLDEAQQSALEGFVRAGGGWAGVHAAADTEYDWPWYGKLVGAWFRGHPRNQVAVVKVEDRAHRSTRMLPEEWRRLDEWYSFRTDPRGTVHVLCTLDEKSYDPEKVPMGADHPVAWCHEFDGGRAWYTALGHTRESYAEPLFREHLREGIAWAARMPEAAGAPAPGKASARAGGASPVIAQATSAGGGMPVAIIIGGALLAASVFVGTLGANGIRPPLLAFLCPGLGHVALGHRRRGFLAMAGVLGMFAIGLLVGGVDAVDSVEDTFWYVAQAGNGPITVAVDAVNQRVVKTGMVGQLLPAPAPADAFGRPQAGQFTVSTFKGLGAANEFGTLFIALGGMLNAVLVMDASRREPAAK